MALYLLDTTIFSELLRGHRKVESRMAAHSPAGRVCICTIVRGEIGYGLERLAAGRRKRDLAARVASLFAAIVCEPISEMAADHYGRLKRSTQRRGLSLDENDLWIAAAALDLNAVLVTRDSDFSRVAGLLTEDWTG